MRKSVLMILGLALLAGSESCLADPVTLTLTSSSAGVYDYAVTPNPGEQVVFDQNQTIALSGLSGVTGAAVSGNLANDFTVQSFNATSAVFALKLSVFAFDMTSGTLVVDSPVLTTGTVDFSLQTANEGTVMGTTQGPVVVSVVEPSSTLLLGTLLLGFSGLFALPYACCPDQWT